MIEIENQILLKMKDREREPIKNGNTIIHSKVGILNYPRGFGRKLILLRLLKEPLYRWNETSSYQYEIIDKLYASGQIIKKNIIETKKTNYSIILCHSSEIHLWKKLLKKMNMNFHTVIKKQTIQLEHDIILTSSTFLLYLLQNYFHRKAIQRIIISNPEQIKLKYISNNILFYGMTWILTHDPKWILYYHDKKHFIYNFIPEKIDLLLFRHLFISNDSELKEKLYKEYNLPPYEILNHKCREEMYVILKGHLNDDMYSLLEKGQIKLVLEKMNELGTCTNIFDYVQEKINYEIDEAVANYQTTLDEEEKETWKEKQKVLEKKKLILKEKIETYHEKNSCIICSDTLKEPILLYCCQNIICGSCIFTWLQEQNKCPYCRHIVHNDDLVSLKYRLSSKNKKINSSYKKLLSKQNKIIDIIQKNKDKYIVFYNESNDILESMIQYSKENNISYIYFQGTKKEKEEYIRNLEKYNLIFISDRSDFIGYSFPMVDHFICYPLLEKNVEEFIFSRFYRYGRVKPFYYHTFMT